ncbi:hypothetical protein FUAX_54420 (plasmid) [Fulvitalea axinellae]|uniref:ATPase AAA-type core domain-containing protein n=1 Tax=Fulvitalea axinellae TaxID=1182444 RepID=A0AAU9CVD2_9BACT|nr:hypothetical protein FUAX_54420 [Fulvitalea axinellae]
MNKIVTTYCLNRFSIHDYHGIKEIVIEDLPDASPWIFLTGENGYGKTLILKALSAKIGRKKDDYLPKESRVDLEIREYKGNGLKKSLSKECVAYGPHRLSMAERISDDSPTNLRSLFESRSVLRDIEKEGLSRWYFNQKEKYHEAVSIFKRLLPQLAEVHVDDNTYKITYKEKDESGNIIDEARTFQELASGFQNIIAMVGDILLHFSEAMTKSFKGFNELKGIVFIDELELYLHPKLQKKLPGLLSDIFPRIQFIASTHSPIPLLGAPEHSVFLKVNRTKEEGITVEKLDIDLSELYIDNVLSSPIFGFNEILSTNRDPKKRIRTNPDYEEVSFEKKLEDRLKKLSEEANIDPKKLFGDD